MLKSLSSSLHDNSIYHIIEFNEDNLNAITFFVININEFGFIKADVIFPIELDVMKILPMTHRIYYHQISIFSPTITEITEKIRIKTLFNSYTKQIILEADDQCWYIETEDDFINLYDKGTLSLLLFTQPLHYLDNGERSKAIYPSFYEAQYRFLNHIRQKSFKDSFKSKEDQKAYNIWESMEYKRLSDEYYYLLHNSHPKRYENHADTFDEWAYKRNVNKTSNSI